MSIYVNFLKLVCDFGGRVNVAVAVLIQPRRDLDDVPGMRHGPADLRGY